MPKLWRFEDYVNHLTHENILVRKWAFKALDEGFPNRYADEVSSLINDEDPYLSSACLEYLVRHEAVQHAPTILETFLKGRRVTSENCAAALGRLRYAPAIDVMVEHLYQSKKGEMILGALIFLGKIREEKCRDALIAAVSRIGDSMLLKIAITGLLKNHQPEDIDLVLNTHLRQMERDGGDRNLTIGLASAFGGDDYVDDLWRDGRMLALENPYEALERFLSWNSHLKLDKNLQKEIVVLLDKGRYQDVVAGFASDCGNLYHTRYPEIDCHENLSESLGRDAMTTRLFEVLSERGAIWKKCRQSREFGAHLISLVLAAYFAMKERGAYIAALSPGAGLGDLMAALKDAGPEFPGSIVKEIIKRTPINELNASLTKDLNTWGDIWTVRIMGQIGHQNFLSNLVRVFKDSDSLQYIHDDARKALNAIDESAHEALISIICNNELDDWDSFTLLENLPYSEAHDLAVQKWENDSEEAMNSYELFSACLLGIGDPRGIEKLQEIYANENDAVYIGNDLECLATIHDVNIPELPSIIQTRAAQEKRRQERLTELDKLVGAISGRNSRGRLDTGGSSIPYKRTTPKVGRNQPCPCGSGKKYKKCCLNPD